MKVLAASILLAVSSVASAADDVRFDVILKRHGEVIEASSISGTLGQPLSVPMRNGMSVDAIAEPPTSDGKSRTQVRINLYQLGDTSMTAEFRTRARLEEGGPSFDYALGDSGLKFRIEVAQVARKE